MTAYDSSAARDGGPVDSLHRRLHDLAERLQGAHDYLEAWRARHPAADGDALERAACELADALEAFHRLRDSLVNRGGS